MRDHWFDEYERLYNECEPGEGEPSFEAVNEALIDRYATQIDRARDAAKYAEFE